MSDSFISWRESPCRKKKQSGCNRLVLKTARMRQGRVTASGGNQLRGLSKLRKMRRFELDPNRTRGPCLPCGIRKIFTAFRAHQRCPSLTKLAKQRARKVGEVGVSEVRLNHLLHSPNRTEMHHVHQTADRQNVKMRISPTPANNLGFDNLSFFLLQIFITSDVDRALFIIVTCDTGFPFVVPDLLLSHTASSLRLAVSSTFLASVLLPS